MTPIMFMFLFGLIPGAISCDREYQGCWKDEEDDRAIATDSVDVGSVDACMEIALAKGDSFFAIQGSDKCRSTPTAGETYSKHGKADNCDESNGLGGTWANAVYRIDCEYKCYKFNNDDKSYDNEVRSAQRTCERHDGKTYTGGDNNNYYGCGDCHCCEKTAYKCYNFNDDDKSYDREVRSAQKTCERHDGNTYTGGDNNDYYGCRGCHCCEKL